MDHFLSRLHLLSGSWGSWDRTQLSQGEGGGLTLGQVGSLLQTHTHTKCTSMKWGRMLENLERTQAWRTCKLHSEIIIMIEVAAKKEQKHHCLTCGAVHGADPTFSCGSFFYFVFFLYLFPCLVPEPFCNTMSHSFVFKISSTRTRCTACLVFYFFLCICIKSINPHPQM